MFKFNFDISDDDDDVQPQADATPNRTGDALTIEYKNFVELPINELLDHLPPAISYSPISISPTSDRPSTLFRRDLFDARFQLISDGDQEQRNFTEPALDFIENPSDLVPGIYEGGLKTWECSLDLARYLQTLDFHDVHGKHILEIGCGTAIPSLSLLYRLFATPSRETLDQKETHVHLQDYNNSVLQLVTFPNVLLAWYESPCASSFRRSEKSKDTTDDTDSASELIITPELKEAFLSSLRDRNIVLRFFSGSWDSFHVPEKYDIVLTSETIYRPDSLSSLLRLMRAACGYSERALEDLVSSQLSMSSDSSEPKQPEYLCLVAAKIVYFGVGGGVPEFLDAVEGSDPKSSRSRGRVDTVWQNDVGVRRKIMRIHWIR